MRLSLGPLQVTIKYTYPRGKTTIYQRAVPTDLKARYPSATIKQDLKTADPIKVARMVAALNDKLEAEWDGLRAAPESSPSALKAHADAFLKEHGLTPDAHNNDPMAADLLHDHIDSKRIQYAGGDERLYRNAAPEDYLTPIELEAGRRLHGTAPVAMLAGSGARLAEIAGLPLEDIILDVPIPHVVLQVHPWRDIKGAKGIRGIKDRTVPLVGSALWAAQRVKAEATPEQRYAFPQYTDGITCKATHASNALNGWMRRLPLAHTCHELRHTVKDQLRAVQCPKDISDAITGHGKKDTGDTYGHGYGHGSLLQVTSEWMTKAGLGVV